MCMEPIWMGNNKSKLSRTSGQKVASNNPGVVFLAQYGLAVELLEIGKTNLFSRTIPLYLDLKIWTTSDQNLQGYRPFASTKRKGNSSLRSSATGRPS